ncbi:MAG: bifunctional tRNA (5-methylaminomethyl-2-thiouridine)(34)-methyltransferase MnmD/FAD-dependent 5-carboxymethylaminomethyl-2-thiouridine(34) oxidoreductase MnmC [Rhodospirillaceae bacterium]|nr:bifunctional tRNA (5-methylaminomethyl-2-thiouridine)(34)-methyltransferase MnmD/FAD-dependent 5-carboxymethylaminomethyl-2-thiouridine(34) oxidoreductase MnmC [Rhodospirillaceae bacterium]
MSLALPSPRLTWLPHGTPYSERFGDVYRSREGAVAESKAVFLEGCGLPDGWREAAQFVVAETGFGTGLNFLTTFDAWRRTKRNDTRLHYIAVEGFPLSHQDLRECVARWPELRGPGQALLRAYLSPQPGFQRLFLDNGRVVLTLLFGPAPAMLAALDAHVDAWYLDGFAPDKNPEMWTPEVLVEVARLSKHGAKLATYTAAGEVRRNLSAAGFDVMKVPGFGSKSEMIRAVFRGHGNTAVSTPTPPWFASPPVGNISLGHISHGNARYGHAAIIGAGLAGAHTAIALHKRGWRTTLIDRKPEIAGEASGNTVGVLMPRLTAAENLDGRFYARAWRFALDQLEEMADAGVNISRDRCGVLQLAGSDADAERLKAIAALGAVPEPYLFHVGASEASDIAGCALSSSALYFPHGGWLNPRLLCAGLARQSAFIGNTTVSGLKRNHGQWDVLDAASNVMTSADVVIFANALSAAQAPELSWLPLSGRRGQISFLPPSPASARLHCVLGYGGYITPAHRGQHCLGATFDWTEDALADQAVAPEDHVRNYEDLAEALPHLAQGLSPDAALGRAAVRCTTPDHLPVAGAVPDQAAYLHAFAELRHGHPWARYERASYQPGLYVLAGLGARGLVAAPLAAEILACQITGEPPPVERDVALALHPGRFLIRDLKRLKV